MSEIDAVDAGNGLAGLLERHNAELLRFLSARCGNASEAEDLMQDLWIKVSRMAPTGPIANGRAYLFRMASNLATEQARMRQRAMARDRNWIEADSPATALPEDRPDPALPADEVLAARQEADILARAIADLPPGAQRALRLVRLEERNQQEVAQIMGISRSGVEKHLAVAMKHLRGALGDCGFFDAAASGDHRASAAGNRDRTDGT